MENIHFLVISPYRGMNELVREVLLSETKVQADCFVANLSEVDSILDKLNLLNYDAVISRGGTASYLKRAHCAAGLRHRPLGTRCPARHTACPELPTALAIIGYENITSHARILCL